MAAAARAARGIRLVLREYADPPWSSLPLGGVFKVAVKKATRGEGSGWREKRGSGACVCSSECKTYCFYFFKEKGRLLLPFCFQYMTLETRTPPGMCRPDQKKTPSAYVHTVVQFKSAVGKLR